MGTNLEGNPIKICIFADREIGAFARDTIENLNPNSDLTIFYLDNQLVSSDTRKSSRYIHFESWDKSTLDTLNASHLVILAWWPRIVPNVFLQDVIPPIVNLHPSLLPIGRGKHPNFWAIVEQEKFGATIHQIDEGIDSGLLIAQEEIHYDWTDTGESLYNKSIESLKRLFIDFISDYMTNPIVTTKSKLSGSSSIHYGKDIDPKRFLELDKEYCLREILNILRASTFRGQPGAVFKEGDQEFEVRVSINLKNTNGESERGLIL
jgi:methionyl-tRNA formyltransferase